LKLNLKVGGAAGQGGQLSVRVARRREAAPLPTTATALHERRELPSHATVR
jgi:hypothetical protein